MHATLTRSVCVSVSPSVTLSFFSAFYIILSHFKLYQDNLHLDGEVEKKTKKKVRYIVAKALDSQRYLLPLRECL